MKIQSYLITIVIGIFLIIHIHPVSASETLTYIHSDHLGSTTLETDATGKKVSKQVYYPYGETRTAEGTLATERHYTGQISDKEDTGLLYYNARYYDPKIGKFTQADTADDGSNRYSYVGNNPIAHTDPLGKQGARFDDELTPSNTDTAKDQVYWGGMYTSRAALMDMYNIDPEWTQEN